MCTFTYIFIPILTMSDRDSPLTKEKEKRKIYVYFCLHIYGPIKKEV